MNRQGFDFQDSGVSPGERDEVEVNEQVRMAVEETIATQGYKILHRMFREGIEQAHKRLVQPSLSEAELRYEQGRFNALSSVQSQFVELAKTKEERGV